MKCRMASRLAANYHCASHCWDGAYCKETFALLRSTEANWFEYDVLPRCANEGGGAEPNQYSPKKSRG